MLRSFGARLFAAFAALSGLQNPEREKAIVDAQRTRELRRSARADGFTAFARNVGQERTRRRNRARVLRSLGGARG